MSPFASVARDVPKTVSSAGLVGFSEEQLRFLAESLPQIAWTGMPDGYIDYMNGRWFAYTGLSPEETYNQQKTAVHPDDFHRYRRAWQEAVSTERPYEVEYRFRRASDGAYRWHLGRGHPVRDMQGKLVKWFGTCTDIHEQKELGEEMRRVNEQLETLVHERTAYLKKEIDRGRDTERKYLNHVQLLQRMINMLPMAAVAVHASGKILYANESFYTLFSDPADPGSLIDLFCDAVLFGAQKRLPSPGWDGILSHVGKSEAFTRTIKLDDGRTLSFDYIPGSGERGSYMLLVRDISAEEQIDAVKAEFMSLASHQLRTPLTSIRWALSRLAKMLQGRLSPDEERLVQKTRDSAATMAQTIRTMLSISRMEAGLDRVTQSRVLLQKFLGDISDRFTEMGRMKNVELQVACPADLEIETDPLILAEILENLLTNAIKYTPEDGMVSMGAWASGEDVFLEVRDTGVGIPHDEQEKVFSKFFRAKNVLHVETSGTGLGLYLVSTLVGALGGTITFQSAEGKGTAFTLRLPRSTKKEPPASV